MSYNNKDEHYEWFSFVFSLKLPKTAEPTNTDVHTGTTIKSVALFSSVKITSRLL